MTKSVARPSLAVVGPVGHFHPRASAIGDHLLHRSQVIVGQMFALIFAKKDVAQLDQVFQQRVIVVGPKGIAFDLGLQTPAFAKFLGADFAFLAFGGGGLPDVGIAHRVLCGAGGSFGKYARALKDLAKIIGYLAAVIVLGALLAPPLYWAGQWLAAHGLPVLAEFQFQKYFNRAELLAALLLLWPTIRWLRVGSWRDLGIQPDPRWRQHLLGGFVIAGIAVALMAAAYVHFGIYRIRDVIAWHKILLIALSAVTVAFLEEALFRGAIFGLLRRSLRPRVALFGVTALFAIVHFLKPDDRVEIATVGWASGFALVPHSFHQFAEPMTLLAGFTTLFALGWLCGDAALRTRALWLSIGLHAGIVFVKMSFSVMAKFAIKPKYRDDYLPWVGERFENGLMPVGVLLLAWLAVVLWLRYENRHDAAPRG